MADPHDTPFRIAYLVNCYPAPSHSFIRREIAAIERLGARIDRWSIRAPQTDLPDPLDKDEFRLTRYIIEQGAAVLLFSAFSLFIRQPMLFLRALNSARRLKQPGLRSFIRIAAYFVEACYLRQQLRRDKVDHVHAHFGTNPAAVACLVADLGGPTFSFTAHGPDEFDNPIGLCLNEKVKSALLTFGISAFGKSQLMRWADPDDWHKVRISRCGVDDSYINGPDIAPIGEAPTLCCVARLSGQKGLPLLIEAASLVKRDYGPFRLNLVGDGELRPRLEAMIADRNVGDCVTILGWSSGEVVRDHLLGARAMVLPSFAEGLPVVIMEALALGRPVIATAIAGTPELVDAGCGWVVPAGSVDSIAEAMVDALRADPAHLDRLGAEGRRRVLDCHDANKNGAELHSALVRAKEMTV